MLDETETKPRTLEELLASMDIEPETNAEAQARRGREQAEWERRIAAQAESDNRARRRESLERSEAVHFLTDEDSEALANAQARETACLTKVREWIAQRKRPILILSGSVGLGKTYAAAYAIAELGSARMVSAHHVLRLFAGRYGGVLDEQRALLTCGLLVVDDVGREPENERKVMASALAEIIDQRRSMRRRTVLTTNMSIGEFLAAYDDREGRLRSRLHQSADRCVGKGTDLRRSANG